MLEQTIIAYLLDRGFDVYAEAPSSSGGTFVTVERTGGYALHRRIEHATVAVQSWAPSTLEASDLAAAVDAALLEMPDHVESVSFARRIGIRRGLVARRHRHILHATFVQIGP